MSDEDLSYATVLQQLRELSPLQIRILYLKCRDFKHEAIGAELGYAASTITEYVSACYEKLGFDPDWHWRRRLAYLQKHYCLTITRLHEGWIPAGPQPEAAPSPTPNPYWLELVRQEERENQQAGQATWQDVPYAVPPLRTVRAGPRVDLARVVEFLMVTLTCAFLVWTAVHFVIIPLLSPLTQTEVPTPSSAQVSIPLTGPATATFAANPPVAVLQNTPAVPPAASPSARPGQILYANDFSTYPTDIQITGKTSLVNGTLVAQEDAVLVIGEDTWKDYVVTFHSPKLICYGDYGPTVTVGLHAISKEHMVAIQLCDNQEVKFYTIDPTWNEIPYTRTQELSACCEVSVRGEEFRYNNTRVTVPGFSEGKVYLWISRDSGISNLVIRSLP